MFWKKLIKLTRKFLAMINPNITILAVILGKTLTVTDFDIISIDTLTRIEIR